MNKNDLAHKITDRPYRAELKHIVAFFGKEKPVWQIKAEECDMFPAAFTLLPPNFEDKIKGGKSIETIVAERAPDDRVLAWATLDKYLSQLVRRQIIWHSSRRKLAECGPRLGVDIMRRACGVASADVRWFVS